MSRVVRCSPVAHLPQHSIWELGNRTAGSVLYLFVYKASPKVHSHAPSTSGPVFPLAQGGREGEQRWTEPLDPSAILESMTGQASGGECGRHVCWAPGADSTGLGGASLSLTPFKCQWQLFREELEASRYPETAPRAEPRPCLPEVRLDAPGVSPEHHWPLPPDQPSPAKAETPQRRTSGTDAEASSQSDCSYLAGGSDVHRPGVGLPRGQSDRRPRVRRAQ